MANRPWLDEVRERLARHALPPAYIRRFMDELSDHFQDITEETMSTEANAASRLGEPEQVAETAVTAYRRRSFLGRHPTAAFLVFAVSPVVSMIALFVLVCAGLSVIGMTAERLGLWSNEGFATRPGPIALAATRYGFSLLTVIIPAVLASILYCKLAKRLGMGHKWMFVSCTMLAIMAMLPFWSVHAKTIDVNWHYALQVGVWIPGWSGWKYPFTVLQLVQFLPPLAIGCWFLRRTLPSGPHASGIVKLMGHSRSADRGSGRPDARHVTALPPSLPAAAVP